MTTYSNFLEVLDKKGSSLSNTMLLHVNQNSILTNILQEVHLPRQHFIIKLKF